MKKKNNAYTAEQTEIIIQVFSQLLSYEEQILEAQKLSETDLFCRWDNAHTAKQILAKVSSLSRPAIVPVLSYVKKPKPAPKLRPLCIGQIKNIIEGIIGYDMFTGNKSWKYYGPRYVFSDILKMVLITYSSDKLEVFEDYSNFDLSEFFRY